MEIKLSNQDIWVSTLIFLGLDIITLLPLLLLTKGRISIQIVRSIGIASAGLWGLFAIVAIFAFWELYYQYIYPSWVRWLTPLDILLYGVIGLGIWWLASRSPDLTILWFVLLGGVEGILEHLLGVYGFHILEKVPWLQGITPFPVIVFSFFEYIFYWTLVAWLGYVFFKVGGGFTS
jgi:hypothetical protein